MIPVPASTKIWLNYGDSLLDCPPSNESVKLVTVLCKESLCHKKVLVPSAENSR